MNDVTSSAEARAVIARLEALLAARHPEQRASFEPFLANARRLVELAGEDSDDEALSAQELAEEGEGLDPGAAAVALVRELEQLEDLLDALHLLEPRR